jgi:hypothetical protein
LCAGLLCEEADSSTRRSCALNNYGHHQGRPERRKNLQMHFKKSVLKTNIGISLGLFFGAGVWHSAHFSVCTSRKGDERSAGLFMIWLDLQRYL